MTGDLRTGLRQASSGLAPDSAGLLPGLVDGDTSRVPDSLGASMKDTGLTHLVAVSGSNLAILSGAVLVVGVLVGVVRWLQLVGAGVVLVGYVLVVGPDPSVLRSAVMAWVALLGLLSGRGGRGLPALSLAVVVLLVADPWFGRDFGFALSVLACAGLLICVRPWAAALSAVMPRFLALAVAVPAAAQAFCAPVIVLLRPRLSLYAVPANLLAAPAVPAATILGVVAMVAAAVWMPAARFVAWWAGWGTDWIAGVARFFDGMPAATVPWPAGLPGAVVLVAVTVVGCVLCAVALRSRRAFVVTAGLTVACVGLLWRPVMRLPDRWLPVAAPVVICDVGQGSGAVVRTGEHAGMVFDVGEEAADIDRCLSSMGITEVPLIVLSHFDLDHVGGLSGVLQGRKVDRVLVSPLRQPPANAARAYAELAGAQLKPDVGEAGMSGEVGGVGWRLVWPSAGGSSVSGSGTVSNESALVALVTIDGKRVVFPADLDAATQAALRRELVRGEGSVPRVDVLVVAHHGSADQDPAFNRALAPRVAVVSVGADNDYGHPAPETLSMLAGMGVPTYRTDRCGSIALTFDPQLAVSTQHDCHGAGS
nr:ComEC/Rec2 family competence protein [Spelaeicoccus albus]